MRILLFFPRWAGVYGIFSYFARRSSQIPPLNLAYVAAAAEKDGHEVRIIDCQAENISKEELCSYVSDFSPHLIGTTSTTPLIDITCSFAKHLKIHFPNIPIVIGGNHITILREKGLDDCFSFGFVGEGERVFSEFLKLYETGGDISKLKGLVYRNSEGQPVCTGTADPIMDLDNMPLPAIHLLKTDKYLYGTMQGRKRCMTIMATRGCPFKCIFCATDVYGSVIRKKSIDYVISEMRQAVEKFGAEHFYFLDDTLTLNKKYVMDLCDQIIKQKWKITFEGGTRANCVDEEMVAKLAEAGCVRLSFGLEAVDSNIRKIMRKEVPLQAYIEANRLTNKYNIETMNSCMIGLPGETKETIRKLLRFLRFSKEIKQANLAIAIPYPGTQLYEMAKKGVHDMVLLTEDYSKYRRYGYAVMDVGQLSAEELIRIQNDAFVSIYMAPWRYIPVYKKQGIIGVFLTFLRFLKSFHHVLANKDGFFWFNKKEEIVY